jgi:hypothetical protein
VVFNRVITTIYEAVGQKCEMFVTGEDSAITMTIAVSEFAHTVYHIRHHICIFHKYTNIRRDISQLTRPKDRKLHLSRLTEGICDGESDIKVEHAPNHMIEIAPHFQHPLDTSARALVLLFSECRKGDGPP